MVHDGLHPARALSSRLFERPAGLIGPGPISPRAKRLTIAALVLAFAVQTALVYTDEPTTPLDDAARRGRVLWHENGCQVCHQIYGMGGFLGPDLTNVYSRVDTVRLRTLLTTGVGQMPAMKMSDAEIGDLRAFLRAIDRPDLGWGQLRLGSATAANPWERFDQVVAPMLDTDSEAPARRGWEAFRARPCGGCHQPLAASPTGAPDLSRVSAGRSDEVRQVLRVGRPARGMPPPAPAMTPDELDDVMAFLEWLANERARIEAGFRAVTPDRAIDWRAIPGWEYR